MRRHPKKGGQFAIIWVDLLYEDAVPATGKLLFERYTGSLGRMAGAMPATRISWTCWDAVRQLSVTYSKPWRDVGQIRVVTRPRREGAGGTERRIFCGRKLAPPEVQEVPAKTAGTPGGYPQKFEGVPAETCGSTSISNYNNTPIVPQRG